MFMRIRLSCEGLHPGICMISRLTHIVDMAHTQHCCRWTLHDVTLSISTTAPAFRQVPFLACVQRILEIGTGGTVCLARHLQSTLLTARGTRVRAI
jgi:hypothetical protein